MVERQSRYAVGYKLANKLSETVNQAVEQLVADFPIRSITADKGSEFSRLAEIKGIAVYFAHPYSSHERGTNENFNGLLREFLPKGQSFKALTDEELKSYLLAINQRPRRLLAYQSSQKQFE